MTENSKPEKNTLTGDLVTSGELDVVKGEPSGSQKPKEPK